MQIVRMSLVVLSGLLLIVLLLLLGMTAPVLANDTEHSLPGADEPYPFQLRELTVEETLRLFSRNLRIGLIIAEGVDGKAVMDVEIEGTRSEYLDQFATLFDFGWYFDGAVLHIFSIGELETKVFALQKMKGAELISMLKSLGVYQNRFLHRADERRQALLVSGPKSYIETVTEVVEALEQSEVRTVKVLRGSSGATSTTVISQDSAAEVTSLGGGEASP